MISARRPWETRVKMADGSYAIGERPHTVSISCITGIDRSGYDVAAVIGVILTMLDSVQQSQ